MVELDASHNLGEARAATRNKRGKSHGSRELSTQMNKEPADLRKALTAVPAAKAKWSGLTPIARRDFVSWIDAAKLAETRARRIERTCDMVVAGKKRPCCYSIVPLDLHLALKAAPTAKAQWSALSAEAKRDLIQGVESAKGSGERERRIAAACSSLSTRKRRA